MKKVLVISYYFPPLGMGGVQRTAKFCKYLKKFGYEPYVLTSSPKSYYAFDLSLLEELEEKNVNIIRTGKFSKEELSLINFKSESKRKIFSKFVKIFFIPDTKINWLKTAIEHGEKILFENKIDLIFSTAPPYTDFLIGKNLSVKYDLPLILDYRDAWYDCPYNFYPTLLHRKLHRYLENKVLEKADKIITINGKIKELTESRYDTAKKKGVEIISQGFDPEDIDKAKIYSDELMIEKKRMRFCYSGSFFNLMSPEYFLKAFKLVFDRIPEAKNELESYFVGLFPDEYREFINELNLSDNIVITGYKNHIECIAYELSSDVLWLMIGRSESSDMISTGKLYEYIGTRKPILGCLPEGEANKSLEGYGAEFICEPDSPGKIAENIIKLYGLYKEGRLPSGSAEFYERYNRERLTKALAELFKVAEDNNRM